MAMTKQQAESLVKDMTIKELEDTAVRSGIKRNDVRRNLTVNGVQSLVVRGLEYYGELF